MKKQIIHSRPLLFIFLAYGLGIYFARSIYTLQPWVIIFCSLAFLTIMLLCLKFKHFKRALYITLAISIGLLTALVTDIGYVNSHYYGSHVVTGRVMVSKSYDSMCSLVLDNVFIDTKETAENISVVVYNTNEIEIGDVITFNANICDVSLFELKSFNSYLYNNNIKHTCSVSANDVQIIKTNNLTWAEKVRLSVKTLLNNNMTQEEAGVCYASLFGDKSDISYKTRENFSISSQAHLLAVSGLHIGFLVAFISRLLSKSKLKNIFKISIIISFLGFYCYLCSFASSVLRASIMFFILSLGSLVGRQYDRLNAWSIAGIFILIIRPMYVYDLGFLLSFACVFCIIVFSNSVKRLLKKLKLPEFLASPLSVSVPVQLGLLPLLAIGYSKISLLGIVASVITVPFFEIIFILLFIACTISLIMPFLSFVLKLPMILMHALIWIIDKIVEIQWAVVNLTKLTGIFVVSIYGCFFAYSNIVNASKTVKLSIIAGMLAVAFIISGIITKDVCISGNRFAVISSYNNFAYYIETNSKNYIIGDFNYNTIQKSKEFLNSTHIYKSNYYISFSNNIPQDDTYLINSYNSDNLQNIDNDDNLEIIVLNNKIAGIILKDDNKNIFFCKNQKFNDGLCLDFAQNYPSISLIVGNNETVSQFAKYLECDTIENGILKTNNTKVKPSQNYIFNIGGGCINNIRSID